MNEKAAGPHPFFRVDLEAVRRACLKPGICFRTGKGTRVHISAAMACGPGGGAHALDREKIFLALTTDRDETFLVRGMEIVNWGIFCRRSGTVTIDGEKYELKAHVSVSAPGKSRLVVKGPAGVALEATLKALGDALAAKAADVTLSRTYKLACGNEAVRHGDGAKPGSGIFVLMLPFPGTGGAVPFLFSASAVTPAGRVFPSFETNFRFRFNDGILEIFRVV